MCVTTLFLKVLLALQTNLWYTFVLQKEARHMTELLIELYNKFYTPLSMTAQKVEIYDCHHKLIDLLEKPERKLILTIMDRKDEIAEELALDSFICGFKLALQLSTELNHYEELPLDRSRTLDDSVAVAMFGGRSSWVLGKKVYKKFFGQNGNSLANKEVGGLFVL